MCCCCCCCRCRCGHHEGRHWHHEECRHGEERGHKEHECRGFLFLHYLVMGREEKIQRLERYRKALSEEVERVEKVIAKLKEEK